MLVDAIVTSWAAKRGTGAPVICKPVPPLLLLLPPLLLATDSSVKVLSIERFSALLGDLT